MGMLKRVKLKIKASDVQIVDALFIEYDDLAKDNIAEIKTQISTNKRKIATLKGKITKVKNREENLLVEALSNITHKVLGLNGQENQFRTHVKAVKQVQTGTHDAIAKHNFFIAQLKTEIETLEKDIKIYELFLLETKDLESKDESTDKA